MPCSAQTLPGFSVNEGYTHIGSNQIVAPTYIIYAICFQFILFSYSAKNSIRMPSLNSFVKQIIIQRIVQ